MDVKFVEGLVALFERSGLAEIEYEENGARIRLTRGADASVSIEHAQTNTDAASETASAQAAGPARHSVKAGLSGVIYMAPAPDQPPFVAVGDRIEEGQTLGIVEAMKMLSPIESEWTGRRAEICVMDATAVEAGTTLFIIEPEA